jgi:protein-S-isoprenylcysteine O-methyltransferase Ste14
MKDVKFFIVLTVQLLSATSILGIIIFWHGQWNTMRWIGLCIGVPALILLFIARFQLGKSFSATAQARELVTHGLYSKIRNPMYIFSGLLAMGFVLAVQVPLLSIILLALLPIQILRARQEARLLEAKFGDAYRNYRNNTWF